MSRQTSPTRPRRYAVIGSGAAGCYMAEALLRGDPEARVDVIERLPTPFGLVRYGVAPDHQGTKAVTRTLGRILENERIGFYGGVDVGRDVPLDELRRQYDATVLATGLNRDRRLQIPGERLDGVLGSGALACWYNDHPLGQDFSTQVARARDVLVIGAGNVSLDVARLFLKAADGFANSDLSPAVQHALCRQPERRVVIAVRRGPEDVKFSLAELKELVRQRPGRVRIDARTHETWAALGVDRVAGGDAVLQVLLSLPVAREGVDDAPGQPTVEFRFHAQPLRFLPSDDAPECVGGVVMARSGGETAATETLRIDLAVSCIGYEQTNRLQLPVIDGVVRNDAGQVDDRLYVVGWARRGASGTIGLNRTDSQRIATRVLQEPAASGDRPGIEALLRTRELKWVDYPGWKRIDVRETERAHEGRCRLKLRRISELWSAAVQPR